MTHVTGTSFPNRSLTDATDIWFTPPYIIKALGPFDMDPCSSADRPFDTAARHLCPPNDDGMRIFWEGRVWMNPPYGREIGRWMKRLASHGDGIALVFARTESEWFRRAVWEQADALKFIYRQLHFYKHDGTAAIGSGGAPSVLVGYGKENAERLRTPEIPGYLVNLR